MWGVIGNDGTHLTAERNAGVNTKLLELSWASYETADGVYSASYIASKQTELANLRAAGFDVILEMGYQTAPTWVYGTPNAYYVDQFGDSYTDTSGGAGGANVIWNPTIRNWTGRYMARVLADFGTNFYAIRVGGGHYGELGYPVASYNGHSNTYWAFDANAALTNPVPGWHPGDASPSGQASAFANWYMDKLVEYQNWQITTLRASYPGRVMVLYPSWGIRPTQLDAAIAVNLNGTTSPEINGEVQRGYDFARQVASLTDANAVVTETWLNASASGDGGTDQKAWSPIKYLASLADAKGLAKFGENSGQNQLAEMTLSADQTIRYGLLGMFWYNESQLFSGAYATLADYQTTIANHGG